MRTNLDHLPAAKQRELEEVVRILFAEFREATENATGRKKSARILKIILENLINLRKIGLKVNSPLETL